MGAKARGEKGLYNALERVGAMPNIGKGHKVDFRGVFEGERGKGRNGQWVIMAN